MLAGMMTMAVGRGASLIQQPFSYGRPIDGALFPAGTPKLGLGLAALGRPGYINLGRGEDLGEDRDVDSMKARCFKVLDAAHAGGVRYFDCARGYGLSEDFLAAWLAERQIQPDDVIVGTKWGYTYTADWRVALNEGEGPQSHEVKDHSLNNLIGHAAESEARLGRFVRLHQIHSATLESGVLSDAMVIDRLVRLRTDRGWKLGLSLSGPGQADTLAKALDVLEHPPFPPFNQPPPSLVARSAYPSKFSVNVCFCLGLPPPLFCVCVSIYSCPCASLLDQVGIFDSVQATYNPMEDSVGGLLERAHQEHGMEVIVKEAMANGRVLQCEPMVAAAKERGVGVDALAIAALRAQAKAKFDPMVLSGAVTAEQARGNLGALELEVSNSDAAALFDACRVKPNDYWAERAGLEWN